MRRVRTGFPGWVCCSVFSADSSVHYQPLSVLVCRIAVWDGFEFDPKADPTAGGAVRCTGMGRTASTADIDRLYVHNLARLV